LNQIAESTRQVVLVLDDYHRIANPAIQTGIIFLLEHLPVQMHIVLLTRADPPLPLARLRSQGELVEVRAADLRLNLSDAQAFLTRVAGLDLAADAVALLHTRTEGWIVGLQLAALALKECADVDTFIQQFSGSHAYVGEYLIEEVLERQSAPVQQFLLQTSILDRLCGPLCDAVVGLEDEKSGKESSAPHPPFQSILENLEHRNLFLVPLDAQHHWYRYHHLFADLLQVYLQQRFPDQIPVLHTQAAAWYEQNGFPGEAIHHALAGQDFTQAVRLVTRNWIQTVHNGNVATVRSWLDALPDSLVRNDPLLSMAYGWVLFLLGQVDAVAPRLDDVVRALGQRQAAGTVPTGDPDYGALPGQILSLRSVLARTHGDYAAALAFGQQAIRKGVHNA
jgi:LuxR family transcriptional regulator, maltose regulon positive regulatory protein